MNIRDFENDVVACIEETLKQAHKDPNKPEYYLFPTTALVIGDTKFMAIEMLGLSSSYQPLRTIKRRVDNIENYLNQCDDSQNCEPLFSMSAAFDRPSGFMPMIIAGQCILLGIEAADLSARFPNLEFHTRGMQTLKFGDHSPIFFRHASTGQKLSLIVAQTQIARMYKLFPCIKNVSFFIQVPRDISRETLDGILSEHLRLSYLLTPCFGNVERAALLVTELSSLYCGGEASERELEDAVHAVPEMLKVIFDCEQVLTQVRLEIKGDGFDLDEARLIPDAILKFSDGGWSFCDFKRALNDHESVFVGQSRRRRFKQSVNEGIAQLIHYNRYASDPVHAEILENLGLFGAPRKLILVVGTMENVDQSKLQQAILNHPNLVEVIDYDTLSSLYVDRTVLRDIDWSDQYTGKNLIQDSITEWLRQVGAS